MKFEYFKPNGINEIAELKSGGGTIFSGGTDLFVKMRSGVLRPSVLIDTKGVKTPGVVHEDGKLVIYMNTTYTDLLKNPLSERFPLLRNIVSKVGSRQIRNRGTPIGNIGNASPAGDFLLAAYVYDANVVIAPSMRRIPISDLVIGPGKLALEKEEFVYAVEFENLEGYRYYYEKVGRRNAMVISIASVAVLMKTDGKIIEDIKIALGSVAPTVVRSKEIEREFKGADLNTDTFSDLSRRYMDIARPITDVRASAEYRKKLVRNLVFKALLNMGNALE